MAEGGQGIVCPQCRKRWSLPAGPSPVDWTLCPACGSRVAIQANLRAARAAPSGAIQQPATVQQTVAPKSAQVPIPAPRIPPPPVVSASADPGQFIASGPPAVPPGIGPGTSPLASPVPGQQFRIPTAPPPYVATTQPPIPGPPPAVGVGRLVTPRDIYDASGAVDAPFDQPSPVRGTLLKWMLISAISAVCIAGMSGVVVLILRNTQGPEIRWEKLHADEIRQDIQAAENAVARNNLDAAVDRFNDIEQLIGDRVIHDPRLKNEVDRAQANHEALMDRIFRARSNPPAVATGTPPPTSRPSGPAMAVQPHPRPGPPSVPLTLIPLNTSPKREMSHLPARAANLVSKNVTDAEIGASIELAVNYLLSELNSGLRGQSDDYRDGQQILATYALLQAGQSVEDDQLDVQGLTMTRLINQMKAMNLEGHYATYTRGLRASALALLNRPEDHAALQADVDWLVSASTDGTFTYGRLRRPDDTGISSPPRASRNGASSPGDEIETPYDNSNSQYGLLGVWSGAEAGCTVPTHFWEQVQQHWTSTQTADGEWSYTRTGSNPRLSMTLAGVASLLVTKDYLGAAQHDNEVGRAPYDPALQKGLDWLSSGTNCEPTDGELYRGYTLYGLERVALASGYKYFGSYEWYPELAKIAVNSQYSPANGQWGPANGSWGNVIETSYELLFLARGRHPIMMNKLLFDGAWDNRPRDVANLSKFASFELQRPLNWQIVPIERNWKDWSDSKILYLASNKAPSITSEQLHGIHDYILSGGMLLTQADGGSKEFDTFAIDLGKELFPDYSWQDLPADHPLYNSFFPLTPSPLVKPRILTNGSRILMIHLPQDISQYWQLRQQTEQVWAHRFGVNLCVYAAGKSDLHNRLDSTVLSPANRVPDDVFHIGLINNGLDSDPEPGAWERFGDWFYNETSLGLDRDAVTLSTLDRAQTPMAHLTGTAALALTPDDIAHIAKYVNDGGVLLIDPCGRGDAFADSARDMLAKAFPDAALGPMPLSHPALAKTTDTGMLDLANPKLLPFARLKFSREDARPQILTSGKGSVIYLPLDMTSGLLDSNTWGVAGYDPDYAQQLAKNLILWVWAGAPQSPSLAVP